MVCRFAVYRLHRNPMPPGTYYLYIKGGGAHEKQTESFKNEYRHHYGLGNWDRNWTYRCLDCAGYCIRHRIQQSEIGGEQVSLAVLLL